MRPLVYVAGPVTKPEPMENTHHAVKVAAELLDSGVVVPFLPHLTCLWHMIRPRPYESWLAYDLDVIEHCDALLRMAGESGGADREVEHAESLGLPLFHDVDAVVAWALAQ